MAGKTRITSSNQKVKTPKEKKKMLSYSPLFIYLNVINRNIKVSVVNKSTLSELGEQNIKYCKNLASIWQLFVILLTGFKYCTSACLLSQQNTDILENKGKMLTQRVVAQAGSCPYVLI